VVTVSNSLAQPKETISIRRRVRGRRRMLLLSACLFAAGLLCQLPAAAQSQTQPAPNKQDLLTVPPATARPAQITSAPRRPTNVAQRRPAKLAPPVTAVVHRLRGWKLRALVTPPDAPFAAAFDDKFVRVSVVAGYVLPDGRSVVARLPRAEAEMLNVSTLFPEFYESSTPGGDSGLLLMKQDGSHVPVKFVGFDSATGLSLLEASETLLTTTQQFVRQEPPVVGERVRLVAPLPAEVAEVLAATETEAQARAAADERKADDQRPVGVSGVMYMSLAEIEGRLTEVNRSPAGRAVGLTLQVERAPSPEWAGSVALTEAGSLAGIVEQSEGREARLLSAEVVRAAAERVKKRRASVPQPWLGARGDAVAGSPLQFFVKRGWPRQQAWELMRRQQGVMLTAVAPGSPAARAGLRPGDVVWRIDNFAVRGIEDMSLLLRETGFDRLAEFTVQRANESPRSFQVRLSESQNPALEMARAEARAAEAEVRAAEAAVRRIDEDVRRIDGMIAALDESLRKAKAEGRAATAEHGGVVKQLEALRRQMAELQARLNGAESEYVRARKRLEEATARVRSVGGGGSVPAFRPLLPFGVKAMLYMTSVKVGGREVPDRGLVVLEVNPDSPAAQADLKAGDVIESIDGQSPHALDLSDQPPAELAQEPTLAVRRGGQRFNVTVSRPAR
jgi:S1-C subfamily serine protease